VYDVTEGVSSSNSSSISIGMAGSDVTTSMHTSSTRSSNSSRSSDSTRPATGPAGSRGLAAVKEGMGGDLKGGLQLVDGHLACSWSPPSLGPPAETRPRLGPPPGWQPRLPSLQSDSWSKSNMGGGKQFDHGDHQQGSGQPLVRGTSAQDSRASQSPPGDAEATISLTPVAPAASGGKEAGWKPAAALARVVKGMFSLSSFSTSAPSTPPPSSLSSAPATPSHVQDTGDDFEEPEALTLDMLDLQQSSPSLSSPRQPPAEGCGNQVAGDAQPARESLSGHAVTSAVTDDSATGGGLGTVSAPFSAQCSAPALASWDSLESFKEDSDSEESALGGVQVQRQQQVDRAPATSSWESLSSMEEDESLITQGQLLPPMQPRSVHPNLSSWESLTSMDEEYKSAPPACHQPTPQRPVQRGGAKHLALASWDSLQSLEESEGESEQASDEDGNDEGDLGEGDPHAVPVLRREQESSHASTPSCGTAVTPSPQGALPEHAAGSSTAGEAHVVVLPPGHATDSALGAQGAQPLLVDIGLRPKVPVMSSDNEFTGPINQGGESSTTTSTATATRHQRHVMLSMGAAMEGWVQWWAEWGATSWSDPTV
jgi:hypothetical protein